LGGGGAGFMDGAMCRVVWPFASYGVKSMSTRMVQELDQFTNKEGCMQKYKSRIINIEADKDPCMQRNLK
jgi:hypothetical protein